MATVTSTLTGAGMAAMAPMVHDFGKLLEGIPSGAWVAISSDGERVLAYSADMREVIRLAQEGGEERPIIFRVPPKSSTFVF